jgi:hypothetical protein
LSNTKIDEAVASAKEEIYSNINDYLEESFNKINSDRETLIENISEYLSLDDTINEKNFKPGKEYIFKTRDEADAASNSLLNYSEEGWEIQGKIITVDIADVAAELDDIIADQELSISKINEDDTSDIGLSILKALKEKTEVTEVAEEVAEVTEVTEITEDTKDTKEVDEDTEEDVLTKLKKVVFSQKD